MRTLIHLALAAGLISTPIAAAAAAVETGQAKLDRLTAGLKAGKMVDCINLGMERSDDSQRLPGIGIIYRVGSTWYVNRFGGAPCGSGCRNEGTPGSTLAPGLRKSPRLSMCVSRGCARGCRTSCDEPSGCFRHRASICSLASFHSGTVVRQ